MLKLDRKIIVSATVAATVALFAAGCVDGIKPSKSGSVNTKASIDGGVSYPVADGKTGPYYVNTKAITMKINNGRVPTKNELNAWNTDLQPVSKLSPEGVGIPEGEGSVEEGEDIYDAKCVMCHGDFGSGGGGYPALSKGNAYDLHKTLTNNRWKDPEAAGPVRVFGSYWPQVTTLFAYIKDGMPHPMSGTLTDNETYALVAYILNINEMKIDGQEVDDDYVLNREKFLKIKMPNVDGFEPNISGANALPVVRAYFANAKNFGAQNLNQGAVRCMHDCQKSTAKVVYIKNGGIHDFHPPMSDVRDLPPAPVAEFDAKKAYEVNCAMCHGNDGMGAPVKGDKDAWAAVTDKGMGAVYKNAINGINGMPAKGGSTLSDKDFKTVVDYIVKESK